MFTPTPEQEAIICAVRESQTSLMIDAKAGCAKTTTLELAAKSLPIIPSMALAFNVKIKKEMECRFPKHFEILTLNGLGHRAWGRAIGKRCTVNTNKLYATLKETCKETKEWATVSSLVKGARHAGIVPEFASHQFSGLLPDDWPSWEAIADSLYLDISDESLFLARKTLASLVKKSFQGEIDYDDQIYMSALFGGVFPKFPLVLIDEAQDLSPLNHIQLAKSSVARLIVCGDPRQAIYAFRGADSSSMANIKKLRSEWIELPLSVTFRCPKKIVERQQSHAPGFTAAPSNAEGEIHYLDKWSIADIERLSNNEPIAILCRNNAPIIAAALRIIRTGRGCTVLGNEIGKSLITLSKKIIPDDFTSADQCVTLIREWEHKETSIAIANKKDEKVSIIQDRAECLIAVIESGGAKTAGALRTTLSTMFSKENLKITLATGHKSKGLEWSTVVHLDPHRLPSKYAQSALAAGNPIPMEQDLNLRYVIETRAQKRLIFAFLESMNDFQD